MGQRARLGEALGSLGHVRFPQQGKAASDLLCSGVRSRRLEARLDGEVKALGIELRLHSWFSRTLVEDGRVKGVIRDTKSGREAVLGKVVIDATGDSRRGASAGAPHVGGNYIVTTVFRLPADYTASKHKVQGILFAAAARAHWRRPEDHSTTRCSQCRCRKPR